MTDSSLRIGITCYPSVGGSGVLASALGENLARGGHEVHFISYERPFRLPQDIPRLHFHPVQVSSYDLFKYPDYTLPLSVKMAEVSHQHTLDILHVHYAVPHATAAVLSRCLLPNGHRPKLVTTLHGTDTMLFGRDPAYGPAIRHALESSDAITAVSQYLADETHRVLAVDRPIEVIHNFFDPRPTTRSREEVRRELGIGNEILVFHASNLRPVKRIDVLLETASRVAAAGAPFKLLVLAGADFSPFSAQVHRLGLEDRILVRERIVDVEEYIQAADIGLFTSDTESFGLSVLEAMSFGCPSVSTSVGGIPEVVVHNASGLLAPQGDVESLAAALKSLIEEPRRRTALGHAARQRARELFTSQAIVPRYETLYRRIVRAPV